MHAYILQKLFKNSIQPNACNFFIGLLICRICHLFSTCGICLVGASLLILVLQLERWTLIEHTSNMEFFSTSKHSKTVWIHATSFSNIYWSTWWLHKILILDTLFYYFFCFENFVIYLYQYKSLAYIKFHLILIIPLWCCIFYKQQYYQSQIMMGYYKLIHHC